MKLNMHLCSCAILLLLAGCSNSDSSPDNGEVVPVNEGDLTGEGAGEISEPAPEGDVPENPLSSTPGGDTRAIAGLWDARSGAAGSVDERYVEISPDGVYIEFDYRQDDLADDGNCYDRYPDLTLTPEDAATSAYSLPDDRYFSATRNEQGSVLTITFAEEPGQQWPSVSGVASEDLPVCVNPDIHQ